MTIINEYLYNNFRINLLGTTRWVERMDWPGIPAWKKSSRKPIILNGNTNGFVKSFKTFNFYWILKAGHMVSAKYRKSPCNVDFAYPDKITITSEFHII